MIQTMPVALAGYENVYCALVIVCKNIILAVASVIPRHLNRNYLLFSSVAGYLYIHHARKLTPLSVIFFEHLVSHFLLPEMMFTLVTLVATLAQVACLGQEVLGNGTSAFQTSINKLFELPGLSQEVLGNGTSAFQTAINKLFELPGLSQEVLGNGASAFQTAINIFFELPEKLLPNLGFQPETLMNVTQIIRHHGYLAEEYSVVTDDGYILLMQRIRPKKANTKLLPILLVHGYLAYSGNFVSNNRENAPAFLFAEAGFDVWLLNQRGTEYSRGHKSLNPDSADYWKFSLDEVAAYDLPACIDRMLKVTGKKQIIYAGHAVGGALPFALLATRPEYMNKIKAIYAFAPMVDLANISELVKASAPSASQYQKMANAFGIYEFPKYSPKLMGIFGKYFDSLVRKMFFELVGPDCEQWNSNRTEVNLAHLYSSTSLNIYYHESQFVVKPGFRKFDWGDGMNCEKHGQSQSPDYDISGITVPTYLFYGENDILAPISNAKFLMTRLKNVTARAAGRHWNFVDFLWAKNAAKEFYNDLIATIKRN